MPLWIVVAETSVALDCPGLPVEKEGGEPAPQEVPQAGFDFLHLLLLSIQVGETQ